VRTVVIWIFARLPRPLALRLWVHLFRQLTESEQDEVLRRVGAFRLTHALIAAMTTDEINTHWEAIKGWIDSEYRQGRDPLF